MKESNGKKLLVFILVAVLIVGAIYLAYTMVTKKAQTPKEEEEVAVEKLSTDYIVNLTLGISTVYNGVDVLYQNEKTTYEDLNLANILTTATRYVTAEYNTAFDNSLMEGLEKAGYKQRDCTFFKGEDIRKAVKELFGKEWNNSDAINTEDFVYNYFYVEDFDVYVVKNNAGTSRVDNALGVDYKIIDTKKKKDKLETVIAVGYTYNNGKNVVYTKDAKQNKVIFKSDKDKYEIPDNLVNEFDQFTITFVKDGDNFVFEKIEKTK